LNDKIWLIKLEEDLPLDENPFPGRMSVIADILSKKYSVIRFVSQLNHKTGNVRIAEGTVRVRKNYEIVFLRALFAYGESKILRYIYFYVCAIQLFFSFILAKNKPNMIICAMPQPIMCFVCALYKFTFSRKTKLILDIRDLWPDIFADEMGRNITTNAVSCLMRRELSFAAKSADGFLGITDFFSNYLQVAGEAAKPSQTFYLMTDNEEVVNQKPEEKLISKYSFTKKYKCTLVFGGTISKTTFTELSKFIDVLQDVPDVVLIVCGHGYFYKDLCKKVVTSNIKIMGNLSYEEFNFVKDISHFGIICVENRLDYRNSLSNKFFDYISSGLPIIANAGGLVGSVIEKRKIGYVYESSEHLLSILSSDLFFSDDILSHLAANVFDSSAGEYSAQNNAVKLTEFVDEFLGIL